MKPKLLRGLLILAIAIGSGTAITMTSNDAHACKKCETKPSARKCGECGSSRLFAGECWTASNGKVRTPWTCQDCEHSFVTELRNGKEVVLTEKELEND